MKYYSELLNKYFDTEQECLQADLQAEATLDNDKETPNDNTDEVLRLTKTQLLNKIDDLDSKLQDAIKNYNNAVEKAADILNESNAEVEKLLKEADRRVSLAKEDKYKAILDYTSKYGPYKKVTTTNLDKQLIDEPICTTVNSLLNRLFGTFEW